MACCNAASVRAKIAATAKARRAAIAQTQVAPKKVAAKKVAPKKVPPRKPSGCTVCGKGDIRRLKNVGR